MAKVPLGKADRATRTVSAGIAFGASKESDMGDLLISISGQLPDGEACPKAMEAVGIPLYAVSTKIALAEG
jgi:hypothetical protein